VKKSYLQDAKNGESWIVRSFFYEFFVEVVTFSWNKKISAVQGQSWLDKEILKSRRNLTKNGKVASLNCWSVL
jgi:hypothetical protein